MAKSICFIQDGLGGGGAEHVICNLANRFVTDGYSVEIGIYGYDTIAYELDKRVVVTKIDRDHYAYKSKSEKLWYSFQVNVIYGILYEFIQVAAKMMNAIWRKPYAVIPGQRKAYLKKLDVTEPISRFIDNRPDAVILSFMVHCYSNVAEAIGKNKKNKFIISERDDPNTVTGKEMKRRRIYAMHMADACVFQTEQAYQCLVGEIGEKGVVIPNPISDGLIPTYTGKRRKSIVNFCRLHRKKNLPLLIRAFKQVNAKHPEYELNIYGKGELQEQLLELIRELNLEDKAFIFDFTSDIHSIIKDCAMFVSSSDFEGISNSMIEAMAIGLPTVCTDCPIGGASMMICSNKNGILIPVGDENALAEAMNYMIENPAEADRMGLEAAKIRYELSCKNIAEKWENVINCELC